VPAPTVSTLSTSPITLALTPSQMNRIGLLYG
jgi:hypothetical protein